MLGCRSFQSISLEGGPAHPPAWAVYDYVNWEVVDPKVYFIKPDGSRLRKIGNGIWLVHFVVEKDGKIQTIDQRWRIGSSGPTLILGGG